MTTLDIQKTFKPKSGKNAHWFYRHPDTFTASDKKEADNYWALLMSELLKKKPLK